MNVCSIFKNTLSCKYFLNMQIFFCLSCHAFVSIFDFLFSSSQHMLHLNIFKNLTCMPRFFILFSYCTSNTIIYFFPSFFLLLQQMTIINLFLFNVIIFFFYKCKELFLLLATREQQ